MLVKPRSPFRQRKATVRHSLSSRKKNKDLRKLLGAS